MLNNIKAMIVVLLLSWAVFRFAKPIVLKVSNETDFFRRRNAWFVLTITGFLSPSFWLFALVAIPLLIWAARKDTNPIALYLLLLHVIPPISVDLPVVAINRLFSIDMYRLLSFCVLIPVAWRILTSQREMTASRLKSMDLFLLGYGAMQALFFVRPDIPGAAFLHDSVTNVMRRAALFTLDVWLPYFVVSRTCSNKRALLDAMAAFCLVSTVMAPVAEFESVKHWLLYASLGENWGGSIMQQYLNRGGLLRSTVSAGHSLALGYLFALAFGFWLYLRSNVQSRICRTCVMVLLLVGLLAAYSRGPWAGALVIYVAFTANGPQGIQRLIKAALIFSILTSVILVTPVGDRIAKVLPLLGGTVDTANVDYRQRLAERCLDVIRDHPWFGDQDAYSELQDMRQGVGVIDFVNVYADVAVFYGLTGLFLFVSFILIALVKAYRLVIRARMYDPDLALLGVCLCACILGTLVMLYTASFIFAYEKMFYILAGLAAAYSSLDPMTHTQRERPSRMRDVQIPSRMLANDQTEYSQT